MSFSIGNHTIVAIYSGSTFFSASVSTAMIENISPIHVPVVLAPTNLRVHQIKNCFANQMDLINMISWQAPATGDAPVTYKVYRQTHHSLKLIATLQVSDGNSLDKGKFKYLDHHRRKGHNYRYAIVSVDAFGNESVPAVVVLKK
jgi:hypothetical protein